MEIDPTKLSVEALKAAKCDSYEIIAREQQNLAVANAELKRRAALPKEEVKTE